MSFYENFIAACKLKDIPAGIVCTSCGLSDSAHSKWKQSAPKSDTIVKLAEYLNVSTDYLLLGKEPSIPIEYKKLISSYKILSPDNQRMALSLLETMYDVQVENERLKNIKTITINLMLNMASAGKGSGLEGGDYREIDVVKTPEASIADFAVKVEGDSMLPDYHDGDIVFVKEQSDIEVGQVGIFRINQSEGFIKEYGKDYLISRNPEFDNIVPSEEDQVECLGLVVGIADVIKE